MLLRAVLGLCLILPFPLRGADGGRPPMRAEAGIPWQPWSPDSFRAARAEGKLVLVDAEATWCHWCHVMDERTYGDPDVARLLREGFVAVKADIDVHPDARELYEDIGWPGTTLYGPDGTVLYRHQGFLEPEALKAVLKDLRARQKAGTLVPWSQGAEPPAAPSAPTGLGALRDFALQEMDARFDEDQGGWGDQKYPVAMNVEAAFREAQRRRDAGWKLRALYTLAQQRHITDPVWGGLFQYSVGPDWHRVHFEKLTILQALYLENLAEAYRATGDRDWLKDAGRVLVYLRRFMAHPGGGYAATMDADVGGYDKSVPFVDGHAYYALGDGERLKRGLPRIDTRRYAREQGLMIAALAALHRASPDPALLAEARRALAYAESALSREGGYLHREGEAGAYFLSDQAAMLRGLLALHEATGDPVPLARAEALAAFVERRLAGPGGRYLSRTAATDAGGPFAQARLPFDDNVAMARGLLRLHALTGTEVYRRRAKDLLQALGGREALEEQGRWLGDFVLAASDALEEPAHLAIVGSATDPRTAKLLDAALGLWRPGLVVLRHDPAEGDPKNPDLGFPPVKAPTAFLCGGGHCSSPFTDPETLAADVRKAK